MASLPVAQLLLGEGAEPAVIIGKESLNQIEEVKTKTGNPPVVLLQECSSAHTQVSSVHRRNSETDGENGDAKKELLQEELYTCALKASFSEAAFIGDLSTLRDIIISCWASVLHQTAHFTDLAPYCVGTLISYANAVCKMQNFMDSVNDVLTRSRHSGDSAANCAADRRRTGWIHEKIPAPGADNFPLNLFHTNTKLRVSQSRRKELLQVLNQKLQHMNLETGGQKNLPLGGVNGTGGVGYGARGTGIAVLAALSDDAARGVLPDSGGYQAAETSCFALHETLDKERKKLQML
ncbi:hypothetical protein U9M48_040796 [Paspalum notatum var. saurae]|uniref:Uncharacterized protein n=1 Tax=Paspalum notatum var. saurae TaxID=547442 RepID=A0AAQ3XEL4_PASNO